MKTFEKALEKATDALGGNAAVGLMLRPEKGIKPGDFDAMPSAQSAPFQFCSSCYRSLSGQPGSILICRPCADAGKIPRWARP